MNGQGPGIWVYHRDANGLVTSVGIHVLPCVNEPPETAIERETGPAHVSWQHGPASYVFDEGATLMCPDCGRARVQEEARQQRLRRLAPAHRAWLARQGIADWPVPAPKEGTRP